MKQNSRTSLAPSTYVLLACIRRRGIDIPCRTPKKIELDLLQHVTDADQNKETLRVPDLADWELRRLLRGRLTQADMTETHVNGNTSVGAVSTFSIWYKGWDSLPYRFKRVICMLLNTV